MLLTQKARGQKKVNFGSINGERGNYYFDIYVNELHIIICK